ncbi:hypothetical protein HPP92_024882 [Vanilla planifolia]|uniref:Uncharacterized protein n=1 Tax=Vanilla planifolia TaxID=51239 RepID=A0A835U9V7_VANPL|nr:hypothetical protein HPP92_024882 [Vanilla planifolia]
MEGDKGGSGSSCRVSDSFSLDHPVASPPQPQQPAIPAPAPKPAKETPATGQRQLFTVELRPGETTIVSWKKLISEFGSGNGKLPRAS